MYIDVSIGDYNDSDFPDANDILYWEAYLEDDEGHFMDGIILQPEYGKGNDVIDIAGYNVMDDLHLTFENGVYYSEDTGNTFDAAMVPYFYDIDEDGDAHLKEEVIDLLITKLDNALYDFFQDNNDDDNSNASSYDINLARAKKLLKNCKYIVACNAYGLVSHESFGWAFRIFDDKKSANDFADEFRGQININRYARVYEADDIDDIEDFSYFLYSYYDSLKTLVTNPFDYYYRYGDE